MGAFQSCLYKCSPCCNKVFITWQSPSSCLFIGDPVSLCQKHSCLPHSSSNEDPANISPYPAYSPQLKMSTNTDDKASLTEPGSDALKDISTVMINLPSFYVNNSEGWFCQADAQFSIQGITMDNTKCWYIYAALNSETSSRAMHSMKATRSRKEYKVIHSSLLKVFSLSKWECSQRVLSITELGNHKPTQLMNYILCSMGDLSPSFLLTFVFMRSLPSNIQDALAHLKTDDLEHLGEEAEWIMALPRKSQSSVCSTQKNQD